MHILPCFYDTDSTVYILINFQPQALNRLFSCLVRVVWFSVRHGRSCSYESKAPAVLKHNDEVPEVLPNVDFKPKCKYCGKEITGSTKVTTNWWKHSVSDLICM